MKHGCAAWGVVLLAACHSSAGPSVSSVDQLFGTEAAVLAAERAPEHFASGEQAREDAEEARARGDHDAAADYATEARLHLAAAITKAHRIGRATQNQRLLGEAHTVALSIENQEARAAHAERALRRGRAARFAEAQARAAFERAEIDEARRYRSRGDLREARSVSIAAAWADRTRRVLTTADTLAREPVSAALRERLRTALGDRSNPRARDALDEIWFAALALLGAETHARQGVGSTPRVLEGLRTTDISVVRDPQGISWPVSDIFPPAGAALDRDRWARFLGFVREWVDGELILDLSGPPSLTEARRAALADATDEATERVIIVRELRGPAQVRATFPTR